MELSEQALRIRHKLFGEEHPNTAESLTNVAFYYYRLDKTSEALELGEQALRIWRKLFGEEHPKTAQSLNNIALYYQRSGDLKHALELGEKAWHIRQKLLGDVHPDTVISNHNLIIYLRDNNKLQEAFARLQHQLSLLKKDHPKYENLMQLRQQLLSKPLRNGFRQPSKHPGKNRPKKRR